MDNGYNTVNPNQNFLIGSETGIYFIFYAFGTSSYTVDFLILDSDNVRIISQNSNSNLAYWVLEKNLYLTNTTSLDIHVARSRIL